MKYIKLLSAVFIISLLSGCGGNEPNNIAYTVALGFDKAQSDNYNITVQYAKVTQISGGASEEGGKGGSEIIQNITVEAPNLYSAINTANHIVSKKFSLSHTKLIVFSHELAQEGIGNIVNSIIKNNEIHPDVYAAVAVSTAREYLEEVKPSVEVNPAKYYQLIYGTNDSGGVPKTNLQAFYFDMQTKYKNPVLPLAGVTQSEGEDGDNELHQKAMQNKNGFDYDTKNYIAGEVAIKGENKSEAMGMAVFYGDKVSGMLGSIDSEMYNLMSGSLRRSYINFKSKGSEQAVVVKLMQSRKPDYEIDLENKTATVNLYIESDLLDRPIEEYDVSMLEEEIQEDINSSCTDLLNRLKNEYNCDIFGFHSKIRKNFRNLDSFNDYKFDLSDFTFKVDAEFYIRRNGMKLQ